MHKTEIRQFIVENFMFGQEDEFADDASLLEKGIIDSTGVMELVAFLEKRFTLIVADDELLPGNLDSVANLNAYVKRKLGSMPQQG